MNKETIAFKNAMPTNFMAIILSKGIKSTKHNDIAFAKL